MFLGDCKGKNTWSKHAVFALETSDGTDWEMFKMKHLVCIYLGLEVSKTLTVLCLKHAIPGLWG